MDLRIVQGSDGGARGTGKVSEMWRHEIGPGSGCPRYLVLLWTAAVHDARMAGADARSGGVLSDDAADYRVRDSVLLGRAHDHVWMPFYAGAPAGCGDQEG